MEVPLNERLKDIYFDPSHPASFSSIRKLYIAAKAKWPKEVTLGKIKDFLSSTETYTMLSAARHRFPRAKIVSYGPHYLYQMDLAQFDKISKSNYNKSFVIVCIDTFAKMVAVRAIKNKSGPLVAEATREIFEEMKPPMFLQTDKGLEFRNLHFKTLMESKDVHHYLARNVHKAAIAERVIKTLKMRIYRYLHSRSTKRYVDQLQAIVKAYNNSYHRAIKMKPVDVNFDNAGIVFEILYGKYYKMKEERPIVPHFALNQKVRIVLSRNIFAKGYKQTFSKETYMIFRIYKSFPPRYGLQDEDGDVLDKTYYSHQLRRVIE